VKRAFAILIPGVIIGAAIAFWLLDSATAVMVTFALIAAAFFGSLPWVIGGFMDRSKRGTNTPSETQVVVRGFDEK